MGVVIESGGDLSYATRRVVSPRFIGLPADRRAIKEVLVSAMSEVLAEDGASSGPHSGWRRRRIPVGIKIAAILCTPRDPQQRQKRLRGITTMGSQHAKAGKQARKGNHPAQLRSLISTTRVAKPTPFEKPDLPLGSSRPH